MTVVLIVADEPEFREALTHLLSSAGYRVMACHAAPAAGDLCRQHKIDLAIVEWRLPGVTGLELITQLRHWRRHLPIIIVTARGSLQDRVTGLDFGADGYLVKPFAMAELQARVRALLRSRAARGDSAIKVGPLSFVPGDPRVQLDDRPVDLPGSELILLETLATRVGSVVSKESIGNRLCKGYEPVSDTAIEICVHRLRRRLAPFGLRIRTIRGYGYLLESPVTDS